MSDRSRSAVNMRASSRVYPQISGTGGCNSYFGEYEYRDAILSISSLGMTEMYCVEPAGVSEQETVYLTTLSLSQLASVADGRLTLTGIGGATLVFDPAG